MRQRGQHRAQHVGRERRREDGFQSRGRQPSHVGAPLVVVFAKRSPGALHVGAAGWAREGGASRTERARGRGRGGWRGWRCLRRPIASVSLGRRCVGGDAEDKWVGVVVGVVLHREDLHPHRGFGTPRLGLFRSQGATLCHLPPRRGVLGLGLKSHLQVLQRLIVLCHLDPRMRAPQPRLDVSWVDAERRRRILLGLCEGAQLEQRHGPVGVERG
mmetsp:Transcript_24950/g.80638  ORF Transcript_24950/g.80638 Transcript_24950/m.80638 type:complete len:215 (-) Transcript_24950:241-885(-)